MKRSAAIFAAALALGAVILAPRAWAQSLGGQQERPREIEKCQTIDKPGSYRLVDNLVSTDGNCLVITADHVTIDLAGFAISGSGTGAGVSAIGGVVLLGIVVRNGSISNFDTGVLLEAADGSIVEGLRISGPTAGGVGIDAHGIVKGNSLISIPATGIFASGTVTGNYVANSGGGISITSAGSTVIGNTAVNNRSVGLFAVCPSNLTDNTAVGNSQGNLQLFGDGCNNTNNVAP